MTALTARLTVPVKYRIGAFIGVFIVVAFGAGAAAVLGAKTRVVTHTQTVTRPQSYGTPSQTVAASQVNPALSQLGIASCDIYASKRIMVCHQ